MHRRTFLALAAGKDAIAQIDERLGAVVSAMVREDRRGLARWAARALPKLKR